LVVVEKKNEKPKLSHCPNSSKVQNRGRHGHDRMVGGFTTIYASSAYHH